MQHLRLVIHGLRKFNHGVYAGYFQYGGYQASSIDGDRYPFPEGGLINTTFEAQIGFNISTEAARTCSMVVKGRFRVEKVQIKADKSAVISSRIEITGYRWNYEGDNNHDHASAPAWLRNMKIYYFSNNQRIDIPLPEFSYNHSVDVNFNANQYVGNSIITVYPAYQGTAGATIKISDAVKLVGFYGEAWVSTITSNPSDPSHYNLMQQSQDASWEFRVWNGITVE